MGGFHEPGEVCWLNSRHIFGPARDKASLVKQKGIIKCCEMVRMKKRQRGWWATVTAGSVV